jgi:serine/threonine protein kinase
MGGVYHVRDKANRDYALKAPIVDVEGNTEVTRRFAREANAIRMMEHQNLASAVDVFVEAGTLYLVMEKVEGRTLTAAIGMGLTPRQTLVFVRQILEGVSCAHGLGYVHRDLKPDNVLLADQGGWERVKIIDFGLVKLVGDAALAFGSSALTRTGTVNGTPSYIAPEQALGRMLDARADLYSIGVILFEALTGRLPFIDSDPHVVMRMHVKVPPPSIAQLLGSSCTPELVTLVERSLAKKPDDRFPDAVSMIASLDAAFTSLDHL